MTHDPPPARPTGPDPDDPALVQALEEALRLQDEGTFDRRAFAKDHPEHADEVLAKLAFMEALVEPGEGAGPLPSTPLPFADPSLVGRRLGDFLLEREIGRGGMGVVFAARQLSLDREVAVKLLPPAFATERTLRDRFEREAAAAAKLAHPGIVKVHAFGEDQTTMFLAMELVDGSSLAEVLAALEERRTSGSPTQEELRAVLGAEPDPRSGAVLGFRAYLDTVVAVGRDIADALESAHHAGLVHRDVKPGNILIDRELRPRLTDFGLVRAIGSRQITVSGQMLGTPGFMAPEMVRGQDNDHRVDLFSLGVVLYQALTLQLPFTGRSGPEVVRKVLLHDPLPLERLDRRIPRDLSNVVIRALEKSPERRYQTAAALRDDLERFLRGDPVLASRVGPVSRALRRVRRRPLVTAIAAALLLAVAAVAALLVNQVRTRAAEVRRAHDLEAEAEARAEAGNVEAALLAYREALRIDPSLETARARVIDLEQQLREARREATRHSALSMVMQVFRDPELAEAADRRVAKLDLTEVSDREVQMLRAITTFVQRRFDETLEHAAAIGRSSDSADVHYLRCWVHVNRDEVEAARAELAKARALPCRSLEDHVLGAEVAMLFGEEPRAFELLRAARAKWPQSPHLPFKLGVLHKDRGHRETAAEAFTTAIQLSPEHVAALSERGFVYLAQERLDLARADFEKALELEPDSDWALAGLTDVLTATGKREEAWARLTAGLARNPNSAVLLNTRGYYHYASRQPAKAIADFRAAIRRWPDHAYAHSGLARALMAAGKREEALQVVAEALKRPALIPGAKVALLNERAVWRWRDGAAAEADLRAALEMRRKPMILANLGLLCLQLERYGDAIPFFAEQMSTGYFPWVGRARRGYCRWMLLDGEGARADCEAAVREIERQGRLKQYPWMLFNLARVCTSIRDDAGALEISRRVAEARPGDAAMWFGLLIRTGDTRTLTAATAKIKVPSPYRELTEIWLAANRGDVGDAARRLAPMTESRVITWPTPGPWIGIRWAVDTTLPAAARAAGREILAGDVSGDAIAALDLPTATAATRAERDWLVGHALFDRGDIEAAEAHLARAAEALGWNYLHVEHAAALARLGRGADAVQALGRVGRNWFRSATVTMLIQRGVKPGDLHLDRWLRKPPPRRR